MKILFCYLSYNRLLWLMQKIIYCVFSHFFRSYVKLYFCFVAVSSTAQLNVMSVDVKFFHSLQHPAMYACAKFVTSPAVVSWLNLLNLNKHRPVCLFSASLPSRTQLELTAVLELRSCVCGYTGICDS